MARIRSIKPEFWSSAQVMECSTNARLFFIGLWNFCDDHGRHPTSERQLKALIFPGDEISLDTIRGMISELSSNNLIDVYTVGDKEYFQVTGWAHQKIDKPQKPKFPARPPNPSPPFDDGSTTVRDRGEYRGDGKGEEKKESRAAALDSSPEPALEQKSEGPEKPKTLEQRCRQLVGEEPVLNDHNFVVLADVVGTDGVTEADVIAGISAAMAAKDFRPRYWKQLAGWARTAAKNRMEKAPKSNGHAPESAPEGAVFDLGSGVMIRESTVLRIAESLRNPEAPDRNAFINYAKDLFVGGLDEFKARLAARAPHLLKFFPPVPPAPNPAEPALAVGR